jgi:DNA-binding transcriptional MerR regulator
MDDVRYSIKDLENFTHIKAHTIRIWEQRYGLLSPKRTDTNIRYYNEDDLKKILNINLLYNSGLKISKIAAFSDAEIIDTAKAVIFDENTIDSKINAIVVSLMSFRGEEIKHILNESLKGEGVLELYGSLVKPLLVKLGELWQVNSIDIIHEHYFSNLFKEFIISQINSLETVPEENKNALLFLHDYEEHEFCLLLANYILKEGGYQCYYFDIHLFYSQIKREKV